MGFHQRTIHVDCERVVLITKFYLSGGGGTQLIFVIDKVRSAHTWLILIMINALCASSLVRLDKLLNPAPNLPINMKCATAEMSVQCLYLTEQ